MKRGGSMAGTLVILTGGLEAGIAMHVLNNWLAFGIALAYGDMGSSLNPTGGSWWSIPVTLTQSLVYLGLAWWVSRSMALATKTDPAVLEASRVACKVSPRLAAERQRPLKPLGYGVIGSTTGSGPVSLGSSPSIPAKSRSSGPGFGA